MRKKINYLYLICLAACIGFSFTKRPVSEDARQQTVQEIVLYVSQQGDDQWTGKTESPNAKKTDGPFATISRARDVIRELKQNGSSIGPVKVYIRKGTYFLPETLIFRPEDSGTEKSPITYAAYPGEKPIISGGFRIGNWQKEGELWVAKVLGVKSGKVPYFEQLFVNNKRAIRARTPNAGFFRIANPPHIKGNKSEKIQKSFEFAPGNLKENWSNLDDVRLVMYNLWLDFHFPIERIDEAQQTVFLKTGTQFLLNDNHHPEGARYFVENVFEALDTPGEWYLDRTKEMLFYYPRPREDMKEALVIAAQLPTLVSIQGNPKEGKFVEYLNWQGLTFSHNEWSMPAHLDMVKQGGVLIEAQAIEAVGLKHATFENCTFTQLGTYGLEIAEGSSHNGITRCTFTDCGAGGIKLNGSNLEGPEYARNSHNSIEDCEVTELGKIYPCAVGIFLQHTSDNLVAHNHVHHLPYTGISVGLDWDFALTVSQNNIIEWNYVHDIGMGVLSDMGGIYTQGVMPGTIIRYNHIHDVESWRALAHGIYLDGSTAQVRVENNLVYNCSTTVIFQSRAGRTFDKDNIIENNIFAFGGNELINLANQEQGKRAFIAQRNIFLANGTPLIGSHYNSKINNPVFLCKNNLYWNIGQKKPFALDHPKFAGKNSSPLAWNDWLALGQDSGSVYEDPLFTNPEKFDFSLPENSPAKKIGFVPFDLSKAGIRPLKE